VVLHLFLVHLNALHLLGSKPGKVFISVINQLDAQNFGFTISLFHAYTCFPDFFHVLLTVHLNIFISVINQLDAQNFGFTISLFHAYTCFEHMCSSSGGQNCIIPIGVMIPEAHL